jgi:formylglycine-generating enzyme required for sulfatase activity
MKRFVRQTALHLALAVAAFAAQAGEYTNIHGITMVDIPEGSFVMGACIHDKKSTFRGDSACANPDPLAYENEGPQRTVRVRAFQIGKTEVTLGQFRQFIKATGETHRIDDNFIKYNAYGDDAPVIGITWNDAQAFIRWLNVTDGGGWRLPSEAEWEYACRAGGQHAYCGGDDLDAAGWWNDNSVSRQHKVGQKRPNAFSLFDMSGNAREWVHDCWHDNYRNAPLDSTPPWIMGCQGGGRVLRGGSWKDFAGDVRATSRYDGSPTARDYRNGFRPARTGVGPSGGAAR